MSQASLLFDQNIEKMMLKVKETKRSDGLRVITCQFPRRKIHLEFIAGVGSAYDPPGKEGQFHFDEHMAFKGTPTRDSREITEFLEWQCTYWNAVTDHTQVRYIVQVLAGRFQKVFEFMTEVYFHSTYPEDGLSKERSVVLREIEEEEDDDVEVSGQALARVLWKNSPLRNSGTGTKKGVMNITTEELRTARKKWYVPSNTVILVVGEIEHERVLQEVNRHIPLDARRVRHRQWSDEIDQQPDQPLVILPRRKKNLSILRMGHKYPLYRTHRKNLITMLLTALLTNGTLSKLFHEIREKRGYAYQVGGGVRYEYPLGAFFEIFASIKPRNVKETRRLICKLLFDPLTDQRSFELAKELVSDWYSLQEEEQGQVVNLLLYEAQREVNVGEDLENHFEDQQRSLREITLEEVEEFRRSVFVPEGIATVIVPA